MRLALILAFVSSVFLTTERAEARPGGDRVAEAKKAKKKTVDKPKAAAKAPAKSTKSAKKSKKKVEPREEEAPVAEPKEEVKVEEEKPAKKNSAVVKPGGAAVSQAGDDEVPRTHETKKKR